VSSGRTTAFQRATRVSSWSWIEANTRGMCIRGLKIPLCPTWLSDVKKTWGIIASRCCGGWARGIALRDQSVRSGSMRFMVDDSWSDGVIAWTEGIGKGSPAYGDIEVADNAIRD
jgi:hypothetical protein